MLKRTCRSFRKLLTERFKPQYSEIWEKIENSAHLDLQLYATPIGLYSELFELVNDPHTFRWIMKASGKTPEEIYGFYDEAIGAAVRLGFPLDEKYCYRDNGDHNCAVIMNYWYNAGKYNNRYVIDNYAHGDDYKQAAWGACSVGNIELLKHLISRGAQYDDFWYITAAECRQEPLKQLLYQRLKDIGKFDLERISRHKSWGTDPKPFKIEL